MDPLKEYIDKNRGDFDELNPPPLVWRSIEMELEQEEVQVIPFYKRSWLRIAAVAIVFLIVGVGIGKFLNETNASQYANTAEWKQYLEAEDYLQKKVDYTKRKISNFDQNTNVAKDLTKLDEVYNELKLELQNSQLGNRDIIIKAMITNYNTKLKILERVLDKTQESEKEKYYDEDLDI